MKKSQITIFLILGIVIAAIFWFLFYVSNNFGEKNSEKQVEKVYNDFIRLTSLTEHVQDCLELSTKEGITLAANQGGRIYDYQIGKRDRDGNLVFYLSFDKKENPFLLKTTDYVYGNNGTVNSALWTFEGRFDAAYEFDNNADIKVNDDNRLDFDVDKNFSVMAWFKTNVNDQTVIIKEGGGKYYKVGIDNNGFVYCSLNSGSLVTSSSTNNVADNLWHHVICSVDRANDKLVLIVDGLDYTGIDISSVGNLSNNGNLLIGSDGANSFRGKIDEIAIFNRTITDRTDIEMNGYFRPVIQDPINPNEIIPYSEPGLPGFYSDVSYGIKAPVAGINQYNLEAPFYPYEGSLVSNPVDKFDGQIYAYPKPHNSLFSHYNGLFPTFTKLCNEIGPNYYNYAGAKSSCENEMTSRPEYNYSLQTMLTEYIINKTKECVNFSYFAVNYKYNITEGNVSGEVLFADEYVYSSLTYPLTINLKGMPPVTKMMDFNFRIDIGYKKLHEFVQHIIQTISKPETEADNIFFNFTDDPLNCKVNLRGAYPCNLNNRYIIEKKFTYCKGRSACNPLDEHYKYSHIIKITDKESKIDGNELVFLFAVENRIPAVDFIDESINDSSVYFNHTLTNYNIKLNEIYNKTNGPATGDSNIVVDIGDTIEIFPLGVDPDDEDVSYKYSGWGTSIKILDPDGNEYVDTFNPNVAGGTDYTHGEHVFGGGNADLPLDYNYWKTSTYYQLGHTSYSVLHRNANYSAQSDTGLPNGNLLKTDVGYHWVRINVTDNEGRSDYQDIKIHVRCDPSHACCIPVEDYHWDYCHNCCNASVYGWPCQSGAGMGSCLPYP